MAELFLFCIGAVFGSFLNVCIYRLPKSQSLAKPGSHCPHCKKPIPFYLNIPILSYLVIRGRCRSCGSKISIQYPLVELAAGVLTLLAFHKFGLSASFFFYTVFIYFLIVIAVIDLRTQMIYNKVLILLFIYGLIFNLLFPVISWQVAGLGLLLGGGAMLLFAVLGKALFKKESLGMGDVKLAACGGFFLGWKMILIALYGGFFLALILIIFLKLLRLMPKNEYIPLAPFLAAGLIVFLFWGNWLIDNYFQLIK